jgi:hypothetical protein
VARSTGAAANTAEYWALAGTEISPHTPVLRALELRPAPALGFLEMAPTDFTESISPSPGCEGRGTVLTGVGVSMGKALQAKN